MSKLGRPPEGSLRETRTRRFYESRRAQMHEYLGEKCAECGTDDERLEIDHIDPSTKAFNPLTAHCRAWDYLTLELDKCQLLCRPCHIEKSYRS